MGFEVIIEEKPSLAIKVLDAAREYATETQDAEYAKYAIKVLQGTAVEDLEIRNIRKLFEQTEQHSAQQRRRSIKIAGKHHRY